MEANERVVLHHRSYTDWIGFLAFATLAVLALLRAPQAVLIILPGVLLDLAAAFSFLLRRPLRRQSVAILPKACSYAGCFGILAFVFFAQKFRPLWLASHSGLQVRVAGLLLWFVATCLAIGAVWRLRYAFSVEPQARMLVTNGPYRLARHPIYTCYVFQAIGYTLVYWNLPVLLAVIAWQSTMMLRIHFEERVLQQTFPEYADYRKRVGMLFPRLRRVSAISVAGSLSATESKAA